MRWAGNVTHKNMRNACKGLVAKPEGKRPLDKRKEKNEWSYTSTPSIRLRGMVLS